MEEFLQIIKDRKQVSLDGLNSDNVFWFGYICGQSKSFSSKTLENFQQLSYYKDSEIINSTFMNFFIMLLATNCTRFNEVFNYFQETLNPDLIKTILTNPEINSLNEVFFISEGSQNYEKVNGEPEIFQENPNYYEENPNYYGENPYYNPYNYPNFEDAKMGDSQNFRNFYPEELGNIQADIECQICLEKFQLSDFVPLNNCGCCFDTVCFNKYLDLEIKARKFPINCPMCKAEVSEQDIVQRVDPNIRENYFEFNLRKFVGEHSSEYSCCPTPDCRNVFIAENESRYSCPLCKKEYCLRCKVNFHNGQTCEKYQESEINKKSQNADTQFMNFVKGTNYKQCPSCKFWVEKSSGCNHMVCRCRYEFCYACGGKYNACPCVGR